MQGKKIKLWVTRDTFNDNHYCSTVHLWGREATPANKPVNSCDDPDRPWVDWAWPEEGEEPYVLDMCIEGFMEVFGVDVDPFNPMIIEVSIGELPKEEEPIK